MGSDRVFSSRVFSFVLPFAPASLKNSPRVGRGFRTSGRSFRLSAAAERDQKRMRALLREVLGRTTRSLFGDDDIAVEMVYLARSEEMKVTVRSAGPKPKGPTGRRRDLQNMAELVLDGLQRDMDDLFGGAYDDDRQIVSLKMERVLR